MDLSRILFSFIIKWNWYLKCPYWPENIYEVHLYHEFYWIKLFLRLNCIEWNYLSFFLSLSSFPSLFRVRGNPSLATEVFITRRIPSSLSFFFFPLFFSSSSSSSLTLPIASPLLSLAMEFPLRGEARGKEISPLSSLPSLFFSHFQTLPQPQYFVCDTLSPFSPFFLSLILFSSFLFSSLALTLATEIFPSRGEARGGKFSSLSSLSRARRTWESRSLSAHPLLHSLSLSSLSPMFSLSGNDSSLFPLSFVSLVTEIFLSREESLSFLSSASSLLYALPCSPSFLSPHSLFFSLLASPLLLSFSLLASPSDGNYFHREGTAGRTHLSLLRASLP